MRKAGRASIKARKTGVELLRRADVFKIGVVVTSIYHKVLVSSVLRASGVSSKSVKVFGTEEEALE